MIAHSLWTGIEEVRRNWGWFLVLGIALIVLGTFSLIAAEIATLASVILFGWMILIGGVLEAISAFWARMWSGFFLDLFAGILYAVVGFLILAHPVAAAVGLTLVLAVLFLVGGIFRIGAALMLRYPNWGWSVLDGVVSLILGVMIAAKWPDSSLLVIGTFVGIVLLFRGWAWVMFALAVRRLAHLGDAFRQPAG
ncbi:MAG: HdeD family acid-resistance protein, partial [Zavarzinella sp.]|nr:HdeD family acid-resistance protein [Zavarzinella sp.]